MQAASPQVIAIPTVYPGLSLRGFRLPLCVRYHGFGPYRLADGLTFLVLHDYLTVAESWALAWIAWICSP